MSEVVVTGRGRNPGGVGLNENTTRLVVCIPVLASPSCCNPIFYVCQDLLSVRPDNKSSVCFSEKHRGQKARVCGSEPCTRRFLPGHYLPLCLSSSVPGHRVACREGLRAMSIDTLLEAARYLEWQAQQQITRGKLTGRRVHRAERT